MADGIYVSMNGAAARMAQLDSISDNLANINTTGFRSDLAQARSMPVFGEHHPSRVYAMTERPGSDLSSGTLTQTGNPLDIAVAGEGWIAVSGPDGREAYTRAGDLRIYKHEYWGAADRGAYRDGITLSDSSQALIIDITITNMGCEDQKVYFMHGVDPDQDVSSAGEYRTCNDTVPSGNFVFSEGLKTGLVTAYGRCDDTNDAVGHTVWNTDARGPQNTTSACSAFPATSPPSSHRFRNRSVVSAERRSERQFRTLYHSHTARSVNASVVT